MDISFVPYKNERKHRSSCNEYEEIWDSICEPFFESLDCRLNWYEREADVVAVIYDGPSHSGRSQLETMWLRYNYTSARKSGILMHEISHRILFGSKISKIFSEEHLFIYLFLPDVYEDVLGETFAREQIEFEKNLSVKYKLAVDWSRSIPPKCRNRILTSSSYKAS